MTPLVQQLRASSRVVVVQPWMVRELGLAAVWFAQLLWHMDRFETPTVVRADHEWEPETGLNRAQVLRAKAKVLEHGWITCDVRKVRGTPTSHIALDDDALEAYLRTVHCPISDSPGSRDIGQSSTSQLSLEVEGETQPDRAQHGEQSDSFAAFWAIYPNHAAKAAAQRAWAKAIKLVTVDAIMVSAQRYADETSDRPAAKKAHAATWLNGRRWEDPPGANASRGPARGATAPVTVGRQGTAGRVTM